MKTITRIYQGTDASMAETARTIYNMVVQDLPAFSAINSRFTAAFTDAFLTQINAADEVITDAATSSAIAVDTEQVLTAMDSARLLYNRFKNHALWAFPESPAKVKEFTNGYREASRVQAQMIVFLETLEQVAQKYLTDLTDPNKGGMPASLLIELSTVRTLLQQKNTLQEFKKKERPVLSEIRINTLNTCYKTMASINNTAQIVFYNQPAKRGQYVFKASSGANESDNYSGTVAANETKIIATIAFENGRFISFENKGLVPLQFDLSTDTFTLEGEMVEIGGGATVNEQMDSLIEGIADGTTINLLVRNLSAIEEGSYWVSVNKE